MILFTQPILPIPRRNYFLGNVWFPPKNQLLQHHELLGESPQEHKLLKMLQSEPSTRGQPFTDFLVLQPELTWTPAAACTAHHPGLLLPRGPA